MPVTVTPTQPSKIQVTVPVGKQGVKGDKGDSGLNGADAQWAKLTQAEYDALPTKDPNTLYVIIG